MKNIFLAVVMLLTFSSVALGQFDYRVVESQAVTGLEGIQQIGEVLIVDGESQPAFKDIVILYIDKDDVDVEVEMSDRTPVAVNPETFQGTGVAYIFDEPGTYFATMEQLKIVEGNIKRVKRRIKFEVIDKTPVLPDSVDAAEYEQVISVVMPIVRKMDVASKARMSEVLKSAIDKMRSFEFKTPRQVANFIDKNRPHNKSTDSMLSALTKDAKNRPPLSWAQISEYYLVVVALLDV